MVTTLTNTGWQGFTTGVWTTKSDTVIDNSSGVSIDFGTTANTLSGQDSITGTGGVDTSQASLLQFINNNPNVDPDIKSEVYLSFGIENLGSIIMGKGLNRITGTAVDRTGLSPVIGIYNEIGSSIVMEGNKNSITGVAEGGDGLNFPEIITIAGIYNRSGSITIGNGNNNSITGIGKALPVSVEEGTGFYASGIFNRQGGTISIGNGNNNSITGTGGYLNGVFNRGVITIGEGNNNSICGTGISDGAYGVYNQTVTDSPSIIEMGDGNNNSITGIAEGNRSIGVFNDEGSIIEMGDGNNDSLTGIAKGSRTIGILNAGDITMGNGDDTIVGTGERFGIRNFGTIHTGAGNDKIIANGGFDGDGSVFLGNGNDYLYGFGNGNFYGGQGKDTLELTTGKYEVSLGASSQVNFKKIGTDVIMHTFEFETLIAGHQKYDFSSLSNNQMIAVA